MCEANGRDGLPEHDGDGRSVSYVDYAAAATDQADRGPSRLPVQNGPACIGSTMAV